MLRTASIALAPFFFAVLASGCGQDAGITVDDILDEPYRYVGQTVTVHGEIAEIHSGQWFTIDGPGLLDDEMLVLARDPAVVTEGEDVAVSGEVVTLVVSEVERELSIDLDPELEVEFSDQPIVIADVITAS